MTLFCGILIKAQNNDSVFLFLLMFRTRQPGYLFLFLVMLVTQYLGKLFIIKEIIRVNSLIH